MSNTQREMILEVDVVWRTGEWFARAVARPLPPEHEAPTLARRIRRRLVNAFAIDAASRSFPNNLGNYRGKRTPRPAGQSTPPAERFAHLQAHYLSFAKTYRNPPTRRDCSPRSARYTSHAA